MTRSVLITGCSDGGLGAALAIAFQKAGFLVYATARNPDKMNEVKEAGCETFILDVSSTESITSCVSQISNLDILINNAGGGYNMPISDLSISEAKKIFDLNVWSYIAVTQAFLPLLVASKGMIVNHTSVAGAIEIPFGGAYSASKAAMAMFSNVMRMELAGFGIKVVELKTGAVESKFQEKKEVKALVLPANTIYKKAKGTVEAVMRQDISQGRKESADIWATRVVSDLTRPKPPRAIWRGKNAGMLRYALALPAGTLDRTLRKATKLDQIETELGQ